MGANDYHIDQQIEVVLKGVWQSAKVTKVTQGYCIVIFEDGYELMTGRNVMRVKA